MNSLFAVGETVYNVRNFQIGHLSRGQIYHKIKNIKLFLMFSKQR